MNDLKLLIFFGCLGSALAGGFSSCEPLESNFVAFENVWLNNSENFKKQISGLIESHPMLATPFMAVLPCLTDQSVLVAANGAAKLSGLDVNKILEIVNGTGAPLNIPKEVPLSCIIDGLNSMRTHKEKTFSESLAKLKLLVPPPGPTPTTCAEVYDIYKPLAPVMRDFVLLLVELGRSTLAAYSSINLRDILPSSIIARDCVIHSMVATQAAWFDSEDPEALINYLSGTSSTLPFPGSCFKSLFDAFKFATDYDAWFADVSMFNIP